MANRPKAKEFELEADPWARFERAVWRRDRCECDKERRDQVMEHNVENYSTACGPVFDAPSSLPSPPNDVGFNLMVGRDAAPSAVNPTTRKRNHVGAIVIFTKQFHRFPGWAFAIWFEVVQTVLPRCHEAFFSRAAPGPPLLRAAP